jgi:hypothetical protein
MTRMTLDDLVVPDTAAAAAALEVASAYQSPRCSTIPCAPRVGRPPTAWLADRLRPGTAVCGCDVPRHRPGTSVRQHTVAFEEADGHMARVFAAGAGWRRSAANACRK